jgi:hypothetical protein
MKKTRATLSGIYPDLTVLNETTFQMSTLRHAFATKYRANDAQTDKFFKSAQASGAVVEAWKMYGVPMYRIVYDFTMDI